MTREAFIACVKSEQEALRGFLLALCLGNKDEADDLAQDVLVKAYLASTGYRDMGRFRSWLFKIAHNTFLNSKANRPTNQSIDEARTLADSSSADQNFMHQDLYLALACLPPSERSAVTLFYLNGYSVREIAEIAETSTDAVKQRLSRGRDKLRQTLAIDH